MQANWSVTKLAKLCQVSRRTLARHFLQELGKSPKAWLMEHRHQHASKLLHSGMLTKEVAACLGYKYANNFSREFKKSL